MKRSNQKGAALILALLLVFILSVMAVSLMFLSQSETWASMNYRLMTQGRYGAEAGLNSAANYLMNTYVPPGQNLADPIAAYTYASQSPVLFAGNPVVLSSNPAVPSIYPAAGVQAAYNAATASNVAAGNVIVNYTVSAQLIAMRQVKVFDTPLPKTIQTWQITSDATINGVRNSTVEVAAILERETYPTFGYAAFATGNGCGSIFFNGGGTIDSYDSNALTWNGGAPVTQLYDGNLGSNGNVNTAAGTTINGTFSSPDTGVGPCAAGNVDALSGNVAAVTGCENDTVNCIPYPKSLIKLPQPLTFPEPTEPVTVPLPVSPVPANNTLIPCIGSGVCPSVTGNYGDISLAGNQTLTFPPAVDALGNCVSGEYYVNSINLNGNAQMTIAACPGTGTGPGNPAVYKPVYINVVGNGQPTPLDLGGNGILNTTFNSSLIQIEYAGTGSINIHGNGQTSAVIYAPNATAVLSGNGTIYGSIIAGKMTDNGNPVAIHYDRALLNNAVTVGNWMLNSFTWSKF